MREQAPWFEDFRIGDEFNQVPGVTVTSGMTAIHQAVFADRGRLFLDQPFCKTVTGRKELLVNPALVCNLAIGQSTMPSQRVMGNLFYRGLRFHAPVFVGDTLATTTRVVALRQNSIKPGRPASGMVVLEITTCNQAGDIILHFWRCPMIPCKDPASVTGRADDFSVIPEAFDGESIESGFPGWDIEAAARGGVQGVKGVERREYRAGRTIDVEARDTVTAAPEIVRMTLNMAMTHTDASRSLYGRRLVYGGHTISVAASQLTRVMPDLAFIPAWYGCEHLAPVFEGDILESRVTVTAIRDWGKGRLADLDVAVSALRGDDYGERVEVLDWNLAALLF